MECFHQFKIAQIAVWRLFQGANALMDHRVQLIVVEPAWLRESRYEKDTEKKRDQELWSSWLMPHAIDPDPIIAVCIFVSRLSNYFPRCSVAVFRMYFPPFVFLQSTSVCLHGPTGENKNGILSQKTQGRLISNYMNRVKIQLGDIYFLTWFQVCEDCEAQMWKYCDLPGCPWHEKRPQHVDNHGESYFCSFLAISFRSRNIPKIF